MLQQLGQANTHLGNLITIAAMVDDILSLVILAVLQQLPADSGAATSSTSMNNATTSADPLVTSTSSETNAWELARPVVVSIGFICVGALLIRGTPLAFARFRTARPAASRAAILPVLLLACAVLTLAAGYAGSTFLLGAFVAGMCFARVRDVSEALSPYVPVLEWLSSIFFASIGLVIPVATLFDPAAVGYGFLYVIPAFFGKFVTGAAMGNMPDGLIVGFAMVGRGELGYVVVGDRGA